MTRVAVAVEGCPMGDSRVIDHKALSALKEQIPVYAPNGWEIVGLAYDFERDENGVISFDIELIAPFNSEIDFEHHHYAHITVGQTLWDQADETTLLVSGVIYSLFVSDRTTPWDVINHRSV